MAERRPDTSRVEGSAGAVPPPGAPYEIAQDLRPDAGGVVVPDGAGNLITLTPQDLAARNERQLQPLTFPAAQQAPVPAAVVPAPGTPAVAAVAAASTVAAAAAPPAPVVSAAGRRVRTAPPPVVSALPVQPAPVAAPPPSVQPATRVVEVPKPVQAVPSARPALASGGDGQRLLAAIRERNISAQAQGVAASHQPAASNTDSPSRGIPRPSGDPGKAVTGGFGDLNTAYNPLDGDELKRVVWVLMDELARKVQDDLRFTVAATYPRVRVRAQVVVEAYAQMPYTIEAVGKPYDGTPVEYAERIADEGVFVVRARRREFTDGDTVETPADALRVEIGAEIPRKQVVGSGNNRQVVDRV